MGGDVGDIKNMVLAFGWQLYYTHATVIPQSPPAMPDTPCHAIPYAPGICMQLLLPYQILPHSVSSYSLPPLSARILSRTNPMHTHRTPIPHHPLQLPCMRDFRAHTAGCVRGGWWRRGRLGRIRRIGGIRRGASRRREGIVAQEERKV